MTDPKFPDFDPNDPEMRKLAWAGLVLMLWSVGTSVGFLYFVYWLATR